jgi:hypothetical protein
MATVTATDRANCVEKDLDGSWVAQLKSTAECRTLVPGEGSRRVWSIEFVLAGQVDVGCDASLDP